MERVRAAELWSVHRIGEKAVEDLKANLHPDEYIWISFEGTGRAKRVRRADLEYAAEESADDEAEIFEDWVEKLFDSQASFNDGNILSLYDCLSLCDERQIPCPVWAREALKSLVIDAVLGSLSEEKKRGRHSTKSKKLVDSLKRYFRIDAVHRVRMFQAFRPCLFAFMLLPVGLRRRYHGKRIPDLGKTFEDALDAAQVSLRGTLAQCSVETLRKSYRTRNSEPLPDLEMFSDKALAALGFDVDSKTYLPGGVTLQRNPDIPRARLPSQLFGESLSIAPDPISERYVELAQDYETLDDFVEALRAGEVVP